MKKQKTASSKVYFEVEIEKESYSEYIAKTVDMEQDNVNAVKSPTAGASCKQPHDNGTDIQNSAAIIAKTPTKLAIPGWSSLGIPCQNQ